MDGVRTRRLTSLLVAVAAAGLVAGCAQFDDTAPDGEWHEAPELTPQAGPQPELPEAPQGGGGIDPGPGGGPGGQDEKPKEYPPPEGCKDHNPAVIGTCLDTVTAVAALPVAGVEAALAGEQRTGRVFKVMRGKKRSSFARLSVSASGGGGLTGLAVSPSYQEDGLVFAYITTPSDNRVVRFAKGKRPKAVLTGIPKGSTGNRGALALDRRGALLVATGDAGSAKAAKDAKSLAGKVLRIDTSGKAAPGNPKAGSPIIASGLHSPGGLCAAHDGSRAWVTDRTPDADVVHIIDAGQPLDTPVWRWKSKPGVAGCVAGDGGVSVAMAQAGHLEVVEVDQQGSVIGKPMVMMDDKKTGVGRISGIDMISPARAVVGTVNKDGGKPVSSDDRVVVIVPPPAGGGAGKD